MSDDSLSPNQRAALAAALKGIREARRLRIADMARLMNLPPRSYEHFEAARGPLHLGKLQTFAEVTNSDPFAILASVLMDAPDFAINTTENKPLVAFMLALRQFHEDLRDDVIFIEPRIFVAAFRRVFQDLAEHVRNRDVSAETWMEQQAKRIGLNLSFGPGTTRKK